MSCSNSWLPLRSDVAARCHTHTKIAPPAVPQSVCLDPTRACHLQPHNGIQIPRHARPAPSPLTAYLRLGTSCSAHDAILAALHHFSQWRSPRPSDGASPRAPLPQPPHHLQSKLPRRDENARPLRRRPRPVSRVTIHRYWNAVGLLLRRNRPRPQVPARAHDLQRAVGATPVNRAFRSSCERKTRRM